MTMTTMAVNNIIIIIIIDDAVLENCGNFRQYDNQSNQSIMLRPTDDFKMKTGPEGNTA